MHANTREREAADDAAVRRASTRRTLRGLNGGTGRRRRLKISRRSPGVWVRFPPQAPLQLRARHLYHHQRTWYSPNGTRLSLGSHLQFTRRSFVDESMSVESLAA